MEMNQQEYGDYLNQVSPNSKLFKDMVWAFVVGGIICTIGQLINTFYMDKLGLNENDAKGAVSITMIFLGALLTGLNLYHKIAKHAGAGTLVPITGFANAIVSPAMEFKREGLVLGLAAKMFVIAGPVLVYGITSSVAVGMIYLIIKAVM